MVDFRLWLIRLGRSVKAVASPVVFGVLGNYAFQQLQGLDPSPLRDVVLILIWPIAIISAAVVAVVWLRQPTVASPRPEELRPAEVPPARYTGPQVLAPTIVQEPTEDVLRKNWQGAEARAENERRARQELRKRTDLLHAAVDTLITWLYRRENWDGLTPDGRSSEAAPWDIWARQKYDQLGLNGVDYQPPTPIAGEPGFRPRTESDEETIRTLRQHVARLERDLLDSNQAIQRAQASVRWCHSQDGKLIRDGETTTLVLQHGPSERLVTGTVRAFEQDGETRWEISTGDPQYPGIGFLPEHVVRRLDPPPGGPLGAS